MQILEEEPGRTSDIKNHRSPLKCFHRFQREFARGDVNRMTGSSLRLVHCRKFVTPRADRLGIIQKSDFSVAIKKRLAGPDRSVGRIRKPWPGKRVQRITGVGFLPVLDSFRFRCSIQHQMRLYLLTKRRTSRKSFRISSLDLLERFVATCKYRCSPIRLESRAASPRDPKAR